MNRPPSLVFSLREQIANHIRNDVLCGRLAEGERLNEVQLVKRFGVSRTPIREAMQQLLHEGLLEGRPNSGLKVASHPPDAVCQLIVSIRRNIEIFALRSFFRQLTPEDFKQWEAILERMRTACIAGDYAFIAECDIEFHRSIVRRAGLSDIEAIWTSLVGRIRSHFWQTQRSNYSSPLEIYEEHVQILDKFRGNDLEAAVAALEEKIN